MAQPNPSVPPPPQSPMFGNQPSSVDPQQFNRAMAIANLTRRMRVGANNFYWIGALSVVNSFMSAFGGGLTFVIGLAVTQLVDGLAIGVGEGAPNLALPAKIFGLALSIVISGIVAIFGYFAGRGRRWAFLTGMILYGLDALVMLVFADWIGFAFHLFFLWGLFSGFQALNQLQKVMPQPAAGFPQDIGVS